MSSVHFLVRLIRSDSSSKQPALCLSACEVVCLEPDPPSLLLRRFQSLSIVQREIRQDTIGITRIGTASRQFTNPDSPSWSYPMIVQLLPSQIHKSVLLTGSVARRWYCALKRGGTYRVVWEWLNDTTDVPRITSLQSVPINSPTDEVECSHVMSPQDALILSRSRSCNSDNTVTSINVEGLLVHKTVSTSHGCCLWCAQVDQRNDQTAISHLLQIDIPPELDWTQWSAGFPGPFYWIRIYDLHWVRLHSGNGMSVKLMASALSRIEWIPQHELPYLNHSEDPEKRRLYQRDCAHCRTLWKCVDVDEASHPMDRLIGTVPAECSVLGSDHALSVRACIIKCLEFQWYASVGQRSVIGYCTSTYTSVFDTRASVIR